MKPGKNYSALLFLILSITNAVIFVYRDRFAYHTYATYSSLYSSDTAKWKKFVEDYPKSELTEANVTLERLHLRDQPTSDKVEQIGRLLYDRFHKQLGFPSAQLAKASPLEQYKILLSSDTIKLWCGNFADMFAFFCWSEGIACRVIEIINPGDHHVLNECYLPETGEWSVTDLTSNNLLFLNPQKTRHPNLLSLRDSPETALLSIRSTDTSIVLHPFDANFYKEYFGNKNPIYYYYRINASKIYQPGEKIKRYFFPESWYEEVTTHPKSNLSFYIKQLFILLWLISSIVLITQFISFKS